MNTAVDIKKSSIQTIYLKDYTPPIFAVQSITLDIAIFEHETYVTSTLQMQRQHAGDLRLLGRDLELLDISLDGKPLTSDCYNLDTEGLMINNAPDTCTIVTRVRIHPETNSQLEGLYKSGNLFCTQNEPEGFRKITFYPDRPDVLSTFTTRLEADKCYPTLLANGNLIEKGAVGENRHYTIWQDPTHKPSYLFACVAGDLAVLKDTFVTSEGRNVSLEIYTESKDIAKCPTAMHALKDAMRWDEEHYGRAYDLDNYMIVAVSQFNMGAMENKGLNIFNTACVLADPITTTDMAMFYVKVVIAHEYFHNWTGNRITCRDWFQLCLKEGFTVFRDQSFSDTLQSAAVQRIDDVSSLKSVQFAEDAGPLSHPPRPDHFVEINNFYTATVYDKGAEIARMMANLLGKDKFRAGTDEYFKRHDGQAVTVEDLISSLSAGSGIDLSAFLPWYSQPGTPHITGNGVYDATQQTYTLNLSQSTPKHPNYPAPQALPIPIGFALFDRQTGKQMALNSSHETSQLLMLQDWQQTFVFNNIKSNPVASLLRDFSAPVLLDFSHSEADIAFLMQFETNGFNQWQAAQQLLDDILLADKDPQTYLQALKDTLPKLAKTDPLLASRLLEVPTESYIASRIDQHYEPTLVKAKRDALITQIADTLPDYWKTAYDALPIERYVDNSLEMGKRAYRNAVLAFACHVSNKTAQADALAWASQQYETANCMTERLAALRTLVHHQAVDAQTKLDDFYKRFNTESLAIDLWFSVQASNPHGTPIDAKRLTQHADFDLGTPNRIRSVTAHFASNPCNVWTAEGITFYAEIAKILDAQNPILAARILNVLSRWYTLAEPMRSQAFNILQGLEAVVTSGNVKETLANLLNA